MSRCWRHCSIASVLRSCWFIRNPGNTAGRSPRGARRPVQGSVRRGPPVPDLVVPGAPRFGMDFTNATAVAGVEIFRDDPRLKRYGLSDIPMTYAPAVTPQSPLVFVQQAKAETPH